MSPHADAGELLPCPFCGPGQSMVSPWHDDVSKRWAVGCGRCGASSGRSVHAEGSKEAAIKSWNTRNPAPRSEVQSEGYKSEAEGYAASLRQMSDWHPLDIDQAELRAAADFIDRAFAQEQEPAVAAAVDDPRDEPAGYNKGDERGRCTYAQAQTGSVREALDAIDHQLDEMRSLKGWRLNLIRENMAKVRAGLAVPSAHSAAPCKHPNAKFWMDRDDDIWMICPECNAKWVEAPTVTSTHRAGPLDDSRNPNHFSPTREGK